MKQHKKDVDVRYRKTPTEVSGDSAAIVPVLMLLWISTGIVVLKTGKERSCKKYFKARAFFSNHVAPEAPAAHINLNVLKSAFF